jgi:hypothetical protein
VLAFIAHQGTDAAARVERIEFAGGTVWSPADIDSILSTPTNEDDFLWGTAGNDGFTALAA